jgi:hypothetical protein
LPSITTRPLIREEKRIVIVDAFTWKSPQTTPSTIFPPARRSQPHQQPFLPHRQVVSGRIMQPTLQSNLGFLHIVPCTEQQSACDTNFLGGIDNTEWQSRHSA